MVAKSRLPPELISLVHHVELNKAGWWAKAIQQVIVTTIWLSGGSLTLQDILQKLREHFSVDLSPERVGKLIEGLCASDVLVAAGRDECFKISERKLRDFEQGLREAETLQEEAHQRFLQSMARCCPDVDPEPAWRSFNDDFLLPLIHDMGARTYELVSGTSVDVAATPRFQQFLQQYAPEVREPLRAAAVSFLDPKDSSVRSCILHELNAYFFLQASNLSEETVDALNRMAGEAASFTVFVDTNFLFSALGLHENPSNEAAQSLMDLVRQLSGKVSVQFYVLPITVDEARLVLQAGAQFLGDLSLTSNLAQAAATVGLTGLARKFAEESKRAGHPLRAQDYFEAYVRNLINIAKCRGVEFFNQKLDRYRSSADVAADVEEQLEFERNRPGFGGRAKGRQQLEHDMVLWHFVDDLRPLSMESPLDAKSWIVTVDLRLLGFDGYKRRSSPNKVPVCIHPATLIQMLQLWMPRTQELEEAVLGNLRLPCLFQEFDPDTERVTIRILGVLGRFENIGDLPKEAVASILMNNALRQKLRAESDAEKQIELVREALIEENQRVRDELKTAHGRAQDLESEDAQKAATIEHLQERVDKLERDSRDKDQRERAKAQIRSFAERWVLAPLATILALGLGLSIPLATLTELGPFWSALTAVGACSASLILWVWLTDWRGSRDAIVSQWRPFSRFHDFKNRLFAVLGLIVLAVLAGVLANALWERIKAITWW